MISLPAKLSCSFVWFSAAVCLLLSGVQSGRAEELYITNAGNSVITTFDTANGATSTFAAGLPLQAPEQIAFDRNGDSYVANANGPNVLEYGSSGVLIRTIGGSFSTPTGVAISGSGIVYVSNAGNATLSSFDPASSTPTVTTFSSDASLHNPYGLALDAAGNVFVANSAANSILEFSAQNGSLLATLPIAGTSTSTNSNPRGLLFDGSGDLYVSNSGSGVVEKITAADLANALATSSAPNATTLISGLNNPRGLALDNAGNLYVAESGANQVDEFDPATNVTSVAVAGLDNPTYVSVPEPSSWALLIPAGAVVLFLLRRQRPA